MPLPDGRFYRLLKSSDFSNLTCFFERFFAHNSCNVLVESFLGCFWHFKFLTDTTHFAKAIAFASWPIFRLLKSCDFSNLRFFFLSGFFTHNSCNVLVESFLEVFGVFNF